MATFLATISGMFKIHSIPSGISKAQVIESTCPFDWESRIETVKIPSGDAENEKFSMMPLPVLIIHYSDQAKEIASEGQVVSLNGTFLVKPLDETADDNIHGAPFRLEIMSQQLIGFPGDPYAEEYSTALPHAAPPYITVLGYSGHCSVPDGILPDGPRMKSFELKTAVYDSKATSANKIANFSLRCYIANTPRWRAFKMPKINTSLLVSGKLIGYSTLNSKICIALLLDSFCYVPSGPRAFSNASQQDAAPVGFDGNIIKIEDDIPTKRKNDGWGYMPTTKKQTSKPIGKKIKLGPMNMDPNRFVLDKEDTDRINEELGLIVHENGEKEAVDDSNEKPDYKLQETILGKSS
ncbi:hypothetical protein BJ508DRAFT_324977 [Ascobolus immersus RN42]|uniref:Uncharacterized protein n=1 Tax=Ascobolus immersus RN42 TaxID=1160509 RepID=A0A3N4ICB1_ASCIM|nr:hypothetical protein BJ508DRAFT_324977 [Ascobolus immersus RN42]